MLPITEKGKSAMIFGTKKVSHSFDKGMRAHSDGREKDELVETAAISNGSVCLPTSESETSSRSWKSEHCSLRRLQDVRY